MNEIKKNLKIILIMSISILLITVSLISYQYMKTSEKKDVQNSHNPKEYIKTGENKKIFHIHHNNIEDFKKSILLYYKQINEEAPNNNDLNSLYELNKMLWNNTHPKIEIKFMPNNTYDTYNNELNRGVSQTREIRIKNPPNDLMHVYIVLTRLHTIQEIDEKLGLINEEKTLEQIYEINPDEYKVMLVYHK